jgi:hypothetical protein
MSFYHVNPLSLFMNPFLSVIRKNALTVFFLLGLAAFCNAQNTRKADIIVLKSNTRLDVTIQEVQENIVKYKKLADPDGPVFSVKKEEIASILYGNGEVATFPDTSTDEFFKQDSGVKPVEPVKRPVATNEFDAMIFSQNSTQLKESYRYYKSKSKRGLVSGIVWTVLGSISMGVGAALITDNGYYNSNYNYNYNDNSEAGAALVIGGLIGGATLGTIGFVKAGRNGSKATRIRRELGRRGESVSFRLKPGYNAATGAGYLSLKMTF